MKKVILYIKFFIDAAKCILEGVEKCADSWPKWPGDLGSDAVTDSKESVSDEAGPMAK